MKTKQHLLFIAFFLYASFTFSQVFGTSSISSSRFNVLYDSNFLNAAYAGNGKDLNIDLFYRDHYIRYPEDPNTFIFNAHAPVNKNIGVGLSYNYTRISLIKEKTTALDFSYKYKFKGHQLSFGVKGLYKRMNLNFQTSQIKEPISTDPTFNLGVGILYKTNAFYTGIAVINLIDNKLSNNNITIKDLTTYAFNSGFVIDIKKGITLQPSFTLLMTEGSSPVLYLKNELYLENILGVSVYYYHNYLFGAGIMSPELFKMLKFGVNYEFQDSSSAYSFVLKLNIKDLNTLLNPKQNNL